MMLWLDLNLIKALASSERASLFKLVGNLEKDLASTRGLSRCRPVRRRQERRRHQQLRHRRQVKKTYGGVFFTQEAILPPRELVLKSLTSPLTLTLPLFMTGSTMGTPDLSITRSAESFWAACNKLKPIYVNSVFSCELLR